MGDRALDVFDGDTAVKEVAVPREALPTGAIERMGRAITAVNEIAIPREALPTGAIDRLDTALAVPIEAATAATPLPPDISPAIAPEPPAPEPPLAVLTDRIARQRGLPPISEPYVRERESVRVARGWLVLSIAIAVAALVAAAAVVLWARAAVERARDERPVQVVALPAVAPAASPPAQTPPPMAAPAACAPPMTELTIESRHAGVTVVRDGEVLGHTPLVLEVPRYESTVLWFRAPGRVGQRQKIRPTDAKKTVRVTLERRP